MLKPKQMFLKEFYQSLNVVVPGHEFFSVKCAQFPEFSEHLRNKNQRRLILPLELLSLIFKINLIKKKISKVI